ncbi:MAG: hypothetical protein R6V58_04075 [Planctomycetota bacterium]
MRAIAGAILIHAGCVLATVGGVVDDVAFIPVLAGVAWLLLDLLAPGARKPAAGKD